MRCLEVTYLKLKTLQQLAKPLCISHDVSYLKYLKNDFLHTDSML